MTTIAYRDGVLAGDTLVTQGDTKLPSRERKVWKLRTGHLFGAAGACQDIETLRRSVLAGEEPPKLKDCSAVLISPDGKIEYYEGTNWTKENTPYGAIGSGASFALTAMWMGADAKKAVKAGIHFDRNSGGRVHSVKL